MTLLLTWLFPFAIIMGADSAATYRNPETGEITDILTGIQKVFHIPKINAGISCWGNARVGDENLDTWLPRFIQDNEDSYESINDFSLLLQDEIRHYTPEITAQEGTYEYRYGNRGFHLSGFVKYQEKNVPTFYHIHNGQSEAFRDINPRIVNANHDRPPQSVINDWAQNKIPYTRNGDFLRFAQLFDALFGAINNLKVNNKPISFPEPSKFDNIIEAFSEFVRFWIRLTRDIYALSNLAEIIGGNISILAISPSGEVIITTKP